MDDDYDTDDALSQYLDIIENYGGSVSPKSNDSDDNDIFWVKFMIL